MSTKQPPVLTPDQVLQMHSDGAVLPPTFTVVADNGQKTDVFLLPGARITKPENAAITPKISSTLVILADLTEYLELGGSPPDHGLSNMIDGGDAFFTEHDARLRGLVKERCAQLSAWLQTPHRPMKFGVDYKNMKKCPPDEDEQEWREEKREGQREHRRYISQAEACLRDLVKWA